MVTRVESPAGWVESMNSGSKASSTTTTGTSGRSPLPPASCLPSHEHSKPKRQGRPPLLWETAKEIAGTPQRSSLWSMLSMEQHKGTGAGLGSPLEGQDRGDYLNGGK